MAEGEGMRTRIKGVIHGTKEVPGILVGSMFFIFVNTEGISVYLEDDVLMILNIIAIGMSWAAQVRMTLCHPACEEDVAILGDGEWVRVGCRFSIPADIIIIGTEKICTGRTGREIRDSDSYDLRWGCSAGRGLCVGCGWCG